MMPGVEGNTQKSKGLRWVVAAVLVVGIVGIATVAGSRAWRTDQTRKIVLTDGTRVEFLGTTVGNQQITTDNRWQQIARRYLPARYQHWLPSPTTGSCTSGTNEVAVYLSVTTATGTNVATLPWQNYVTEDASGFRYGNEGGYCSFGGASANKVYGFAMRAFPRREREFLFHLLDAKGAVMGTLRVPNPVLGPFPEWKASPLPQTKTNGRVVLTLKGLKETGGTDWRHANPSWGLESTDAAWAKAKARSINLMDATGNEGQFLSVEEKAWKLSTLVYRSRLEDFTANEQLVVTNLAVPEPGKYFDVDQSADCAGAKINVLVIAGAGEFGISNGVTRFMGTRQSNTHSTSTDGRNKIERWGSSAPFLLVEASNVQTDDDIEFYIRNESGKEQKLQSSGYNSQGGVRRYTPKLSNLSPSSKVTIRIVVNRPVPFEFMVDPKVVKLRK